MLYEFDVRYHMKVGKSDLSCFTACTKQAPAGALIHRQQTIYRILKQTKLSSIYRRKLLCPDETSRVACNSGETQTRKVLLLFGRDRIYGEILAIGWQEEGNFEVNRCYIQIYLANF